MIKNDRGFSLIEILVALFIGASLYGLYEAGSVSSRKDLDELTLNLERAVRYSVDESALRNSIVRIHFFLDNEPQEWSVEFGPDDSFVLPIIKGGASEGVSLKDREKYVKQIEELNKSFNLVKEFDEKNKQIEDNIAVIAVGTSISEDLITEFHASIYFYPSGEKDSAIIILGSEEELVSITIDPFTLEMERNYHPLEIESMEKEVILTSQRELAKELFNEWIKK
jgi:prepilin-type N-terminal cleavage/methylation domain-containing protein